MSSLGIPQVALVMGSSTAGGAYVPAMSDETVIVKGTGTIFLGGPPLVKAATGEEVSAEDLGGAEVHARISGVADHEALDDEHAIALGRSIVRHLERKAPAPPWDRRDPEPPAVAAEGGDGRRLALRRDLGRHAAGPCRFASSSPGSSTARASTSSSRSTARRSSAASRNLDGWPVAILANDGILFSQSALKGAHFIELACQRRIPLVFLQNITGFMVGREYEAGGIAKDGAKLVTAVATAAVPKFTVLIGGSFGAGNYAMAGRAYQPRFLWTLAELAHLRDGRRTGGAGAVDRSRLSSSPTRSATPSRRRSSRPTSARARPTSPPPDSGTTGSSTRSTPGASCRSASRPPSTPHPRHEVRRLPDVIARRCATSRGALGR